MTDVANVLQAAAAVAGSQSYPQACLYLVATPIGNLADMGLRALHVLRMADVLACEDTRHTQTMLRAWGMQRPASQLLALHQHNEKQAAQAVVRRLQAGQRVAYVSDAGTPAISDPGAHLVQAVQAAGLRVMPIPGASSVIAALSASGADMTEGWVFAGFLPAKGRARQQALAALGAESRAVVLFEAPHRMALLCAELAVLSERTVTLARELTKQFESIHTLPARDLLSWLQAVPERSKGEFVVVVHPQTAGLQEAEPLDPQALRTLQLLLDELPLKTAVRLAAEITGVSRNPLYEQALQLKQKSG